MVTINNILWFLILLDLVYISLLLINSPDQSGIDVKAGVSLFIGIFLYLLTDIHKNKQRQNLIRHRDQIINFYILDIYDDFGKVFLPLGGLKILDNNRDYEKDFKACFLDTKAADLDNKFLHNFNDSFINAVLEFLDQTDSQILLISMHLENEKKIKQFNNFALSLRNFRHKFILFTISKKVEFAGLGQNLKEMAHTLQNLATIASNESQDYLDKYQPPPSFIFMDKK